MSFTVIRVFEKNNYDETIFKQIVDIGDLYSEEFERELENKGLDWEEYYG